MPLADEVRSVPICRPLPTIVMEAAFITLFWAISRFCVAVWLPRLSPLPMAVTYSVPSEVMEATSTPEPLRQICA